MSTQPVGAPSNALTADFSDVIDSYYRWVKARILAVNPQRKFQGIIQALDWPFKEAAIETIYLAIATDTPSRQGTPSSPAYTQRLSWVYLVQGADLRAGQQGPNRSKYRTNNTIKRELILGNFPQFCERQQWSLDENENLVGTSYYPSEGIWWNSITFKDKVDKTSGILFGDGSVSVTSFAPTIQS